MTYEQLLKNITQALPETDGKMSIERVRYVQHENKAYFSFLSDVLIGEKGFFILKDTIKKAFPDLDFSLRVSSPNLARAFMQDPAQFAAPMKNFLLRNFPSVISWQDELYWSAGNSKIILGLPDSFAQLYLHKQGVDIALAAFIRDVFRIDLDVELRINGDEQKRLAALQQERARQDKLASERAERIAAAMAQPVEKVKPKDMRIKGRAIAEPPVPIRELTDDTGFAVVRGKVLSVETKEISNGEMVLLTFLITDFTSTIRCKSFLRYRTYRVKDDETPPPITDEERENVNKVIKAIKPNMGLLVRGDVQNDSFSHETCLMVRDITECKLPERMDNAPEKRIELHLHTKFSTMDGLASATSLIERAAKWGHSAIAVTDHGVDQAFPEAFGAAKKNGIKLIPGCEAYLTDDDSVVSETDLPLDTPIVVLDFETTGLNVVKDRMIEIGAVKLQNGTVIDSYGTFVNPQCTIPEKIEELTGISNQMVREAPLAAQAVPELLEFIGSCPIAAHNAKFDCSILENECKRLNLECNVPHLDTLTLARKMYPELKTHKLASVCKRLGVSLKGAHRAVNDAAATAQCLAHMIDEARKKGAQTLSDLNNCSSGYTLGNSWHIVLLAATQEGMTNLNHIISEGHLNYFKRRPHVPRAILQKYRKGIIVGSACESGELFSAMVDGASEEKLCKMARFYDYLEVQPIGNNAFLIREGRASDENQLRDFNRRIVAMGEKLGIPVVATGDVHFLDPEDAIFRTIIQASQGFDDADQQAPLYFKTTEEMLQEFAYLGKKKAHEIVIENPRMIADRVENVSLFPKHPEGKTTFSPFWPEAEDDIRNMTWNKAHEMYGEDLPEVVKARLDKELGSIIGYGYATLYSIANKLVTKSLSDGYVVGSRGSVGSSLVACMCGITEVNALPPHYRCAKCHKGYFDIPPEYTIGVDLPDKPCPVCGEKLLKDGFDIPFEVFLGFKGDKVPDIDLNFSGEYQPVAHAYVKELFGEQNVFRAGTIGTVAEKTAYGYVLKYLEERNLTVSNGEKDRLAAGCVDVKRTTGQHPAGMVVLPKGYDICQFTAIQHPADDMESGTITTHYDFNSMHDILVKLDILGHDDPTMLHMLEELTGVNFRQIPLDDKGVMSLFKSPEILGVKPEDIDCNTGTFGVPEFGTAFVRQMLEDTHPTTMQELIRISGLSHGTDVWLGNAKDLIDNGIAPLAQCLCTRDDIMNQLIQLGVPAKMSFDIMESVRKGKGLKPEMADAMHEHNVPQWFEDSCRKIKYMFPKGHAVAYVTMALRVAWYKVYRPLAYYAAYFTIRGDGFDACTMIMSKDQIHDKLHEMYQLDADKKTSAKDKESITALEMVQEMMARGFRFAPADLYKSDVKRFLPVGEDTLLVPFTALGGLGEAAAQGIVDARSEPFLSVEDLKERGKVSSAVISLLRDHGCLKDMPETNQLSLFSL